MQGLFLSTYHNPYQHSLFILDKLQAEIHAAPETREERLMRGISEWNAMTPEQQREYRDKRLEETRLKKIAKQREVSR